MAIADLAISIPLVSGMLMAPDPFRGDACGGVSVRFSDRLARDSIAVPITGYFKLSSAIREQGRVSR